MPASMPAEADGQPPRSIRERLDWRPKPTIQQDLAVVAAAAAPCVAFYALTSPPALSIFYALSMACAYAFALVGLRALVTERMYSQRLCEEQSLGDKDSRFVAAPGDVVVHYRASSRSKAAASSPRTVLEGVDDANPVSVHCYHGLGAIAGVFDVLQRSLPASLPSASVVSAHCMPGFGLTSRPEE